jgi:hypothetical protein
MNQAGSTRVCRPMEEVAIEFLGQPPQRTAVAPQPGREPGSSTPKRVNLDMLAERAMRWLR